MKKKATVEVLYRESVTCARHFDDESPDSVTVIVTRWTSGDDAVAVLARKVMLEGKYYITAQLQRLGIRVFDELKAAHPTLSQE